MCYIILGVHIGDVTWGKSTRYGKKEQQSAKGDR